MIFWTLLLTLLGALAAQVNPIVLKYTVDEVQKLMDLPNPMQEGIHVLILISIILLVKEILNIFINFGQKFYGEKIRINVSSELAQRAIDKIQSHLSGGLAFLATVGSTAPFVGLFGTVWGIYHALTAIGISGQASIDKVAGPVGEALIMTAIGLAVAVPAVLGYNWLTRRNKAVLDNVRTFGSDLHTVLLSGEIKNSSDAK